MRILVAERGGEGQALHMQKPSYSSSPPNKKALHMPVKEI